jgi:hypothetical protein
MYLASEATLYDGFVSIAVAGYQQQNVSCQLKADTANQKKTS